MGALYTAAVAFTPTATADNAALTANGHLSLRTAAALDAARVSEIFIGGESTSSTVNQFVIRRHTTNSGTPTSRSPAPTSVFTQGNTASSAKFFITASIQPTVAATATIEHVLSLSMNTFGGIIRWVAAPGEEIWIAGNTANTSEMSLSTVTGTGAVSAHFVLENL